MSNQQKRIGRVFDTVVWGNWDTWTVCEYLGRGIYLLSGRSFGIRSCRWKEIGEL